MSRLLQICLLAVILLSCTKKKSQQSEPELENLQGSLSIRGLTVFGYENNQLSYQLKSRYMIQSLDRNHIEFGDFVMQKMDAEGNDSLYLANKVIYTFDKNQAVLLQTNLENYRDELILSANSLLVDFASNTFTGDHAQIKQPNQRISGKKIFYDLISGRIEFTQNVEGEYGNGTSN